jgi:hypothetical protein
MNTYAKKYTNDKVGRKYLLQKIILRLPHKPTHMVKNTIFPNYKP